MKVRLGKWPRPAGVDGRGPVGLGLVLTLGLEGKDEELVFDVVAEEGDTTVRRLDWPGALDAREVDYTVLPNVRGNLLPRDWPHAFDPIRPPRPADAPAPDTSEIQSNVIESWSMSWWGFKKGPAAMIVIVEMGALNERLALVEMTAHEFLDPRYRKERTTFADATTVTVDWDAQTATVSS